MIKQSIFITLLLWIWGAFFPVYAEGEEMNCEYAARFQECKVANQNGSSRSIEDFICISSTKDEDILDQIILDVEFKKIDDEVEEFLVNLWNDKQASVDNKDEVIDEIANNLIPPTGYYQQYKALCNGWILAKRASCWVIPITVAWERVENYGGETACMNLVWNKLDIYAQVANDTMKLNIAQVRGDRLQSTIIQELRGKFNTLISMMTTIIWNVGRLARWVTHWTPDPK